MTAASRPSFPQVHRAADPVPERRACADFEVALPPQLAGLGRSVRAALTGSGRAVPVLALGGISGDRFVCRDAQGGAGWWPGLIGEGHAIDPSDAPVLGVDYAADDAGRIAPTSADQAAVMLAAMDAAGIDKAVVVGASYGGMVALSLAALHPHRVERLVVVSADAAPHPMATAIREVQRRTVAMGVENGCGEQALAIARGMAMLSYRTAEEFGARFTGGCLRRIRSESRDRASICALAAKPFADACHQAASSACRPPSIGTRSTRPV